MNKTPLTRFISSGQSDNAIAKSTLQPMLKEIDCRLAVLEAWFLAVQQMVQEEADASSDDPPEAD